MNNFNLDVITELEVQIDSNFNKHTPGLSSLLTLKTHGICGALGH